MTGARADSISWDTIIMFFGSRTHTRTRETGTFTCPREQGTRRYGLASTDRWLCVGRWRLAPVEELARFVECRSCRSTFDPRVVDAPDAFAEDTVTAALRRLLPHLLDPQDLSPADRREAVIVLQRHASVPYGSGDLERDLGASVGPIEQELAPAAPVLNAHGRDALLDATVQLISRGECPDQRGLALIHTVSGSLSMPSDRTERVLQRRLGPTSAMTLTAHRPVVG